MKKGPKKVICFLTDTQTFEELHKHSERKYISLSQLLRSFVRKFLASEGHRTIELDGWLKDRGKSSDEEKAVHISRKEKIQ